jgi:hypothetical protein
MAREHLLPWSHSLAVAQLGSYTLQVNLQHVSTSAGSVLNLRRQPKRKELTVSRTTVVKADRICSSKRVGRTGSQDEKHLIHLRCKGAAFQNLKRHRFNVRYIAIVLFHANNAHNISLESGKYQWFVQACAAWDKPRRCDGWICVAAKHQHISCQLQVSCCQRIK